MATKTVSPRDGASFTHVLAVDSVPDTGLDVSLHASETECALLAQACGAVAVHEFDADFEVRKKDRARFQVTGCLRARITQICVVSLEPFETLARADIDVDFAPPGRTSGDAPNSGGAAFPAGEDPPDPIVDGKIDLGALAAEFLILNLDVYPRKPGMSFGGTEVRGESSEKSSPFAVLRRRS